MHNVESHLMLRYADNESSPARRVYARLTAAKLATYERSVADEFDGVFVCSEADRKLLTDMNISSDVVVVPNGIDPKLCQPTGAVIEKGSIVFVGSMDYHANRTGILHFVKSTLPLVLSCYPDAKLYIVGKNPGPEIMAVASSGIIVTGMVDDVRPYLELAAVVIVPLLVGGGTRLKILEALAMGKAVVSTSLGCEGIDAKSGDTISLADRPEMFARAVVELLRKPEQALRLGARGRTFVLKHYDWNRITGRIIDCYNSRAAVNSGSAGV
jgi:polysaccharide biosynthesis protein PslH